MSLYSVDSSTGDIDLLAGSTKYADNPIGTILPYGGTTAPSGWFLCQGQAISRTDYADLFAVIGTAFGSGNGSTTFNIPDLRESVPVGVGENDIQTIANHDVYALGEFKDDNLGKHDHPLTVTTRATYNTAGVPVGVGNNNTPTTATHGKQLGVNYIIKAKHIPVPTDFKDAIDDAVEDVYGDVIPNNASSSNKLVTRTDIPNINPLVEMADCNSIFYGLMYCGSNTSHKPVEVIGGMLLSFMSGTVQNPVGIQIFIPYNGHRVADFYFRDNTNDFSPWRKLSGEIID